MPRPLSRRSATLVAALATAVLLAGAAVAAPALAASDTLVISEVYGGGGNSGATYKNDFIELADYGPDQSLAGYSVQYLSGGATTDWQVTPLTGSIAINGRYLIQEAQGSGGSTPLPTPDDSASIAMSATAGTVALVSNTTRLTCKTTAACASAGGVVDLVGYGTAVVREGTAATGASNEKSVARSSGVDTDDNAVDFTAGTPTPQNTGGGTTPPPTTATVDQIQGTGFVSSYAGTSVSGVAGVVTAVKSNGFWLQQVADVDADPATSEGIYVFTSSAPTVVVGDSVTVSATVSEYRPGGASTANLTVTELDGPTVTVVSSGNPLPGPVVIGPDTVPDSYAFDNGGNSIETLAIDPSRSALDYYESIEGMLVEVDDAQVVGPSNQYGEQYVTTKPEQARTYRGGAELLGENQLPSGRLEVVPLTGDSPAVDVGDEFSGATVGPLDYSNFGGYVLRAATLGVVVHNHLPRVVAQPGGTDQLSIATYNVENLSPVDSAAKFTALARGVVTNLAGPDIVALEEIQDNDGPTDDGVVAADKTLNRLIAKIKKAGGPKYRYREIDPADDQDGGQPGGNIRVAFLFNPARVSFVGAGPRSADRTTTATQVTSNNGNAGLTLSPGRIDPTNSAWDDSRKPLVGEFRFQGQSVFVIANHFDSKGGDQSADGRFQYPAQSSAVQRQQQATLVHDFVGRLLDANAQAKVVVVGDLNDYQFSPAVNTLKTGTADGSGTSILTDLITTLPVDEQYTYVYNGVSQVLDHILATSGVTNSPFDYQVVHVNSEYHDQVSDHDPQVVDITP